MISASVPWPKCEGEVRILLAFQRPARSAGAKSSVHLRCRLVQFRIELDDPVPDFWDAPLGVHGLRGRPMVFANCDLFRAAEKWSGTVRVRNGYRPLDSLPIHWQQCVRRSLAVDPEGRHPTALAFALDLSECMDNDAAVCQSEPTGQ